MRNLRFVRAALALLLTGLAAACGDGPMGNTGPEINASGRVYALSGAAPAGLRVTINDNGTRTSADVRADGTFSISATAKSDTIDIIIDAATPSARTVHPALIRHAIGQPFPDLRFVMVPLSWTVTRGTHAGSSAQISVDGAFNPPCATAGDTNCDGFYPKVWNDGFRIWPSSVYPIRVVFDHANTTTPITPADSIAFWTTVDRMNADFGTQLFRPARNTEVTFQSEQASFRPNDAISVRVDGTLTGFGAFTNWWWNGNGDLYSGVVRPRNIATLRSTSVMTHELLHTQGFKHSCSWVTVMGGYGGCGGASALSLGDVAHAHVALEVAARQKVTGAPHGLIAARNGQRVLILDKPPLSSITGSLMGMLRGGDAIGEPMGDHANGRTGFWLQH